MKARIAKVDEQQFSNCVKHKLWGANHTFIDKWDIGELLIFSIDRKIAAIAEITGKSYMDDTVIWDNGLFWNRIPLEFRHILAPEDRIPMSDSIKEMLIKDWGPKYGWGILNKTPLNQDTTDYIISEVQSRPNSLAKY